MLKLGSLGQKIGQLLAVLHDNGRLFPHRRRVSPAMAIPTGKNVKGTPGGAGRNGQVVSSPSAEMALARLAELKAAGADVPLVLADQQMPGMSGTQLLARVRQFFPTARRGLLIPWGERSTPAPFLEAAALGQLEFYLNKPELSPDEQFHRVITGSLEEWWRERGRRSELVTVIGDDPSARVHEIRDVLTRNNVPFGFYASDSPEGRAALRISWTRA